MSLVATLVGPVTGLLDKFIEDKDQKAMLAHKIATMSEEHHQDLMKAQIEVNKVEASNSNLFVSGVEALYWLDMWAGDVWKLHHNTIRKLCTSIA